MEEKYIADFHQFIDENMKEFLLKNYLELYDYQKELLFEAVKNQPAPIEYLFLGLMEINKYSLIKRSLRNDLQQISKMTLMGVAATKAGEEIRKFYSKQ